MERTIAIGLDGVSWNILDPLLETGRLPRLQELRERGSSGVLESTVPFFTGAAWASFATGASPGAHGIYDFMTLRPDLSLSVAHQGDLRRPTYYQHLGHAGRRSVLVNMPLDQFGSAETVIVNSWLTDDPARRILPVGRMEQYAALLAPYKVFPGTRTSSKSCARSRRRASTWRASSSCGRSGSTSSSCSRRPTGSATRSAAGSRPATSRPGATR